jgi:hypothetical protein
LISIRAQKAGTVLALSCARARNSIMLGYPRQN